MHTTDTTTTEQRQQAITDHTTLPEGAVAWLASVDGVRGDKRHPLGRAWAVACDALVAAGWMRRSRSRRYWWN